MCDIHVKLLPGSSAVTDQTAGSNFGCLTRARLPMPKGPASNLFTDVTDAVHSGQCATSLMTFHIRSAGAAISIVLMKSAVGIDS